MGDVDEELLRELRESVRRIDDRLAAGELRDATVAKDVRTLKQVVGMLPATQSIAPQANTYRLRTLITVGASVAAGAAFDKFVALLAHLMGGQ